VQHLKDTNLNTLARIRKEASLMPAIVFAVEDWEKQLLLLGKAGA
jgi:hypothetical protein